MTRHWWARAVLGRTSVADPLQDQERPDARFETEWRPLVKRRLLVALGVLAAWAVGIEVRLIFLQLVHHEHFVAAAAKQQQDIVQPEAPRGDILDRNGEILAYTVEAFELHANPSRVKDAAVESRELCAAMGDCDAAELAEIAAKLKRDKYDVIIRNAREMSPNAAIGVQALIARRHDARAPASISLVPRTHRYYPKLDLAAHLVGFLGGEGKGGGGIELKYDADISGTRGRLLEYRDGNTNEIFTRVERAPVPGGSLELTIDVRLQHIAERELRLGVLAAGAIGGTAIILDPQTGEILAEASYPSFNPNAYQEYSNDERRNRAVTDTYEPGSTFKIVTASAAINEGIFTTSQLIDTRPGTLTIPGRKPITEDKRHNYGVLSFEDVIVKSSNVGAAKIGLQIGADRMLQYARRFGFGEKVAPDFPGESKGRFTARANVGDSTVASMSIGYEVGVTPMQVAAAANVIANGGQFIEPHAVRAVVRNGRRELIEPKVLRRVISPETAAAMTAIMEGVVAWPEGTGHRAALERYRVAGKTGTTKKVVNGRYSEVEYNVSFVGFVPSNKPAFTILVVVDTPRKLPAYGGAVAAPIFKRIAEASLQYVGVLPSVNPAPPIVVATDRQVLPIAPARAVAMPPMVTLAGGRPVMPELRGLALRDALRIVSALSLSLIADGDGVVVVQSPLPGTPIDTLDRVSIRLKRLPDKPGGGDR